MVHHFRHDQYMRIKPALIISLIVVLLVAGAAIAIYFSTKPSDSSDDSQGLYKNSKKQDVYKPDESDDAHANVADVSQCSHS
jgi:flagellar basal body-associated protein FliL